ncbi:hypothetical protein CFC35_24010 [Streptomyces sp. FBKL.4005]|nr:hypothetical protein CFC35_24010 [Streptomyces sp. FBKL.4005]
MCSWGPFHRPGARRACSQSLFRFRRATRVGRRGPVSYLGRTGDPDSRLGDNRWNTLVRTVKFRHFAYARGAVASGYWQVRMARSGG